MSWNWPEQFVGKWWTKEGEKIVLNEDGSCQNSHPREEEDWRGVWEFKTNRDGEGQNGVELYLRTENKTIVKFMAEKSFNVHYKRTLYKKTRPNYNRKLKNTPERKRNRMQKDNLNKRMAGESSYVSNTRSSRKYEYEKRRPHQRTKEKSRSKNRKDKF